MAACKNGNAAHFELHKCPVKIVIIGEPGCGKTTFINAFHNLAIHDSSYFLNGMEILRCKYEFNNDMKIIELVEITDNFEDDAEGRTDHYSDADIFIFMFDLSDEASFLRLRDKWFPEAVPYFMEDDCKIVLLANKNDIGNEVGDPIPFESIYGAIDYQKLSTYHRELSSIDTAEVMDTFRAIF